MAKGSCMCGAVGFEYTGQPIVTALCHCTDCQKWAGSAYTSNVVVPRTAFKVTKGTAKAYNAVGDSGKVNKHYFCGTCGSSLYSELEIMPNEALIKAGTLDGGEADIKVDVEFYTKDRLNFCTRVKGATQERAFGQSKL